MSYQNRLLASVAFKPDSSPGGIVATAMRVLRAAGPTAIGCTLINPDGTAHYILQAEAERTIQGPKPGKAHQ